jgi:hypothetical protein
MEENFFEIYFDDLTEDAQEAFLAFMEIDSPKEGNYDTMPIAIIPFSEEDDE